MGIVAQSINIPTKFNSKINTLRASRMKSDDRLPTFNNADISLVDSDRNNLSYQLLPTINVKQVPSVKETLISRVI